MAAKRQMMSKMILFSMVGGHVKERWCDGLALFGGRCSSIIFRLDFTQDQLGGIGKYQPQNYRPPKPLDRDEIEKSKRKNEKKYIFP